MSRNKNYIWSLHNFLLVIWTCTYHFTYLNIKLPYQRSDLRSKDSDYLSSIILSFTYNNECESSLKSTTLEWNMYLFHQDYVLDILLFVVPPFNSMKQASQTVLIWSSVETHYNSGKVALVQFVYRSVRNCLMHQFLRISMWITFLSVLTLEAPTFSGLWILDNLWQEAFGSFLKLICLCPFILPCS